MKPCRAALMAGSAAVVLTTGACVDSREEYWIDARGGGKGEISFSVPAAALRLHGGEQGVGDIIDSFMREIPGIELTGRNVETTGGRAHVRAAFEFESALDLAAFAESPSADSLPSVVRQLTGTVDVSMRGRELSFIREVTPARALPVVSLLPAPQLDWQLVTIIHLPAPANESNATRTENGGRTLVWETPLATAVRSPLVMSFKMDVPIPWTLVLGVGLPLCLAGGILLVRRFAPGKRQGAT
jgi:hypothetical protein